MVQDNRHKRLLQFIKRIVDVPMGYSREELTLLRSASSRQFPGFVRLIDEYLRLAETAATDAEPMGKRARTRELPTTEMHLFDLLREKRLFSSNADLANFAGRILPGIKRNRFDKMSRADIAARIIEHIETKDVKTREALEASMREALRPNKSRPAERESFLSKWESIIKGTQL